MTAKYSIVQFIPDPVIDERVNIGVIAFDEKVVRAKFLANWDRVKRFANRDVDFLREFGTWITHAASPTTALLPGLQQTYILDEKQLTYMSERWMNTIYVSPARASTKPVEELLLYVSARFLAEPLRKRLGYRDRRAAANSVRAQVRKALTMHVGNEAEGLLKAGSRIQGKWQEHRFDAVVTNGVPYFAAQGLSFEHPVAQLLEPVLDSVAWAIADVKTQDPSFPLAVLALPPRSNGQGRESDRLGKLYSDSIRVYKNIGADVLGEDEVEDWASRTVSRFFL